MTKRVNRRRFLQQSAIGVGAISLPVIIKASVLGGESSLPPSDKVTIGCIGVGGMGTGNLQAFLGLDDCRVVAVCDTYEDRRAKAKGRVDSHYGDKGCASYGDFRELLARKDIDAVMIAVQDHWHALIATAAVKAGKDMYCEKPLGVCVEEGQADPQCGAQGETRISNRNLAAIAAEVPACVRAGTQRLPWQNPHR